MRKELSDKLMNRYPVLLEHISYFECDDGWYDLLDMLCACLENHSCENQDHIKAAQIKEKFAGLRFYVDFANEKQEALIEFAEKMSFRICEVCGDSGHVVTTGYWIKTLCEKHRDEMSFRELTKNSD